MIARKNVLIVLCVLVLLGFGARAEGAVITVNSNLDTYSIIHGDSNCTLREAVENANMNTDTTNGDCVAGESGLSVIDQIHFNIPGVGPHKIQMQGGYIAIQDSAIIDGTTQPGSKCLERNLMIQLDGALLPTGALFVDQSSGLWVDEIEGAGSHSVIKGISFTNFFGAGIQVSGGDNSVIVCNNIGVSPDGMQAMGNGLGIAVDNVDHVRIGDLNGGYNIISSNKIGGITIDGDQGHIIEGNLIGTDKTGHNFLFNQVCGIRYTFSGGVLDTRVHRNIIAGNDNEGILITGMNVKRNSILENNIFNNGGVGIDLAGSYEIGYDWFTDQTIVTGDGVTANDLGDGDLGPNDLLNSPELSSVALIGNQLKVEFDLDVSSVNTNKFRIEFFVNSSGADASGHGEGEIYLGSADVVTDAIPGSTQHSVNIPLPAGLDTLNLQNISATTTEVLTNGFGSTSEFSEMIQPDGYLDFGDAPDSGEGVGFRNYQTKFSDDGAYHKINSKIHLGQCVDMEAGLLQNVPSDADDKHIGVVPDTLKCAIPGDDEDGISFLRPFYAGSITEVKVFVSDWGFLNAWVDWNQDGDWTDTGEHVIADREYGDQGYYYERIHIPEHADLGKTYIRFRYSYQSGLGPTGGAPNGEVEDYLISILTPDQETQSGKGEAPVKWDPVKSGATKGKSLKR